MVGGTEVWSRLEDGAGPDQRAPAMGLTGTMVATDFFRRCIALLQAHPHPAWRYVGDDDASPVARGAEFSPSSDTVVM